MRERIKRHEGLRLTPYQDSEGHWTVGYGFLMENPISLEVAEMMFEDSLRYAEAAFQELSPWLRKDIGETRISVLIEMIFQLGLGGVLGFRKMLMALSVGDYSWAADEILDSKAARQCPDRFREYATLMKDGGV